MSKTIETPDSKRTPSFAMSLFIALLFFSTGFTIVQSKMSDKESRIKITNNYLALNNSLCDDGYRFPLLKCFSSKNLSFDSNDNIKSSTQQALPEFASLLRKETMSTEFSYEHQLSLEQDLSSALNNLQWNNGDETEAVRLLTIISALRYGRQRQSSKNYAAIPKIVDLLQAIWDQYPELVVASNCVYCGSSFDVIKKLTDLNTPNSESLKALGKGHSRLFTLFAKKDIYTQDELYSIANLHAELSGAGDSGTSQFVGNLLLEQKNYELLTKWASRGLNGGRALKNQSLNNFPQQTIISAWENGVKGGYDDIELSEFLFSTGYRPALRWVIWLESTEYEYIHSYNYKRMKDRYSNLIKQFTDFPAINGINLSGHYNENWKNIKWNPDIKKWSTN